MAQGKNTLRSAMTEENRVCKVNRQVGGTSAPTSFPDDSRQVIKLQYTRNKLCTLKNAPYVRLINKRGEQWQGAH